MSNDSQLLQGKRGYSLFPHSIFPTLWGFIVDILQPGRLLRWNPYPQIAAATPGSSPSPRMLCHLTLYYWALPSVFPLPVGDTISPGEHQPQIALCEWEQPDTWWAQKGLLSNTLTNASWVPLPLLPLLPLLPRYRLPKSRKKVKAESLDPSFQPWELLFLLYSSTLCFITCPSALRGKRTKADYTLCRGSKYI